MNIRAPFEPCASALIVLAVALAASPQAAAQDNGGLWEVTTRMEMPGMPAAIPPQTNRVCAAKNRKDEDFIPKQSDCRMVESKRVGIKLTYQMECAGNNPSTITGEMTFGNNAYDGQLHMTMHQSKQTMNMTFSGKRVGDCTTPTK